VAGGAPHQASRDSRAFLRQVQEHSHGEAGDPSLRRDEDPLLPRSPDPPILFATT
jgi:hypothetical protein